MADWPNCYDHVFRAVGGSVRGQGNGRWDALCPAHRDSKRSLSIGIGTGGKLLMKCHAPHGCTLAAIVVSLGLGHDDLFPDNAASGGKRDRTMTSVFVEAYDYRNRQGKLEFQVCRWSPKRFTQRRPNPAFDPSKPRDKDTNPEYLNNLDGAQRILYRLPEVLDALAKKPGRQVFVVEGEADANVLWKAGFVATTNPMGAGKWHPDYTETLRGQNVIVIPDEDPVDTNLGYSPGLRHAEDVCATLVGVAKKVVMLRLPDPPVKGDFRDWWNRLATEGVSDADRRSRLIELVRKTPDWQPGKTTPVQAAKAPPAMLPTPPEPEPASDVRPVVTAREQALAASSAKAVAPPQQPAAPPAPSAVPQAATPAPSVLQLIRDEIAIFTTDHPAELNVPEWWGIMFKAWLMLTREMSEPKPDYPAVREAAIHLASMAAVGANTIRPTK